LCRSQQKKKEGIHYSRDLPGNRKSGRLKRAWMDNAISWTGLKLENAIWKVDNKSEWRTTIDGAA